MTEFIKMETTEQCKKAITSLFSEVGLSDNLDIACNRHPRELPCLLVIDKRFGGLGKDLYVLSYVYSDLSRESAYDASRQVSTEFAP
jgi:hypothetical protein